MKLLKYVAVLTILAAITSCSTVKVVADTDKNADFSNYQTYNFLGWQENSDQLLNDMDKKRIRDAFIHEFEIRGMKPVEENGDMAVSLYLVVDQKTSTTAYTDYYGGGYGGYHRYGYGRGWGSGSSTTTYSESDYLVGTLVMDVFDGTSKDQIWQGIATATISENPAKREKTTPARITALMKKFPVQPK